MIDVEWAVTTGDTKRGAIPWAGGLLKEVVFLDRNGQAFTEGDIRIGQTERVAAKKVSAPGLIPKGMGRIGQQYRWPKGEIPYLIAPGFPDEDLIQKAIAHWHDNTPIRFIPVTTSNANKYKNSLLFCDQGGCWSYVGMTGGQQELSLSPDASVGNVIHEMGHAVGLWHEQSRTDRDKFVEIRFDHIQTGMQSQFRQQFQNGEDLGDYDYESIMHYPRLAFSKDGQETIRPIQDKPIGQREKLSAGDIDAVKSMYR
jgi:hypothetical protein